MTSDRALIRELLWLTHALANGYVAKGNPYRFQAVQEAHKRLTGGEYGQTKPLDIQSACHALQRNDGKALLAPE